MGLPDGYVGINNVVTRYGRKVSLPSVVYHKVLNSTLIDVNGYLVAVAMRASAGTTTWLAVDGTLTGAFCVAGVAKSDMPRNLVITVTHSSSIIACAGVITGLDVNDRVITEAWTVGATGTSTTWTGAKAFKTVTSITAVVGADASTNTIVIGDGKVFGLPVICTQPKAFLEISGGSVVTNGAVVAASTSAAADALGTYTPNAAPDNTTDFEIYYLSNNPQDS